MSALAARMASRRQIVVSSPVLTALTISSINTSLPSKSGGGHDGTRV
ncbi:hypothetical protein KPP03845_200294 (plasmid) [Streptomyces xanthophaeus]|nr:hypothetical protein KPP03845_200294 [Streptomyces xanthophaeus]